MIKKPYSESCDQNKDSIFSVISTLLKNCSNVLEIGSGTGQHAIYFSEKMPSLKWQTSDCSPYIEGINSWIEGSSVNNVMSPIELDVSASEWPNLVIDSVFTANSIHIMAENNVVDFFSGVGKLLPKEGSLIIYGPFNYKGKYTSESNERFDRWLKDRDENSGIKDFETIVKLADNNGIQLVTDYEMPANNRILYFIKK